MPIYSFQPDLLPPSQFERLDRGASSYWELFYQRNRERFFSDRHYLHKEFPELASGPLTLLEAGCGAGNAVFPLLEANPDAVAYACDFSATAVGLVRAHPLHAAGRVAAFVADLTADDLAARVPPGGVDFVTLIFVLSAIDPAKMPQVIRNVAGVCKPGAGRVLVRDYAEGDLAQLRLAGGPRQKKLADNFYVRGDGTRAFYFLQAALVELFAAEGFRCEDVRLQERRIQNRLLGLDMDRRWIQAVFTYMGSSSGGGRNPTDVPADGCSGGLLGQACQGNGNGRCQQAASSSCAQQDRQKPQQQHEWEEVASGSAPAGDDNEPCSGLGPLFSSSGRQPASEDLVEERLELPGLAGALRVRSVSGAHRHTLAHTGLMLWDSAPVLARALLRQPALLAGKRVLEVGCGSSPLVAFAALRHCRLAVCTDGSPEALELMDSNVASNASLGVVERLRLRRLRWGDAADAAALAERFGQFDIVLGADVVYVEQCVPQLFSTVSQLLAPSPQARVILCHITRRVSEEGIIAFAKAAGLVLCTDQGNTPNPGGPYRMLLFALDIPNRSA